MAQAARRVFEIVNTETGEVEVEEVKRTPYAFDGPHINVEIRRNRELASAQSGLTDREYRVLSWYRYATEEAQGPVMMTGADIAKELGMSPDALGRVVRTLKKARLLVGAGSIGRTTFYRTTPHLAFIGSGYEHREAVKDWNPPELNVRAPRDKRRSKNKQEDES